MTVSLPLSCKGYITANLSFLFYFLSPATVTSNASRNLLEGERWNNLLRHDLFSESTSAYLSKLSRAHFASCSLIITNSRVENLLSSNEDIISTLLTKNSKMLSSPTISATTNSDVVLRGPDFVSRLSRPCKLIVSLVPHFHPEFPDQFSKLLIPPNGEVTKRDEDHYVFVAFTKTISQWIFNSPIAHLLRFKIVIDPNDNLESQSMGSSPALRIRTRCIYCSTKKIIQIPTSIEKDLSSVFPDFTLQFNQHQIRMSAPTKYVAIYEMEIVKGFYRHKRGIHALTFSPVADKLNMSYILKPCSGFGKIPEGATGVWLGNGTWAGCMGDVYHNKSDMALAVGASDLRFKYVHFTVALDFTSVTYVTAKPDPYYSWTSIFTALRPFVWSLLAVSIIFTTLQMTTTYKILFHSSRIHNQMLTRNDDQRLSSENSFTNTGIIIFGYLLGEDFPSPSFMASKVSYINWLMCGLVLSAAYTCSLQAKIVSPGIRFVPRTFQQLSKSDDFQYGAPTGFRDGLGEQLFKNSNSPTMRHIYREMEGDKNEVVCMERAVLHRYACFNWDMMHKFRFTTTFADKTGQHPFQMATDATFLTSLNFITRKRELFRSHFNHFIQRAFDTGLVRQSFARDWRSYRMTMMKEGGGNLTTEVSNDGPKPFGLDIVKGSFFILVAGYAVCLSTLMAEIIDAKYLVKILHFFRPFNNGIDEARCTFMNFTHRV